MTCPSCGKQAITFSMWATGINAFRTRCMNCGAELKGNKAVVWGFIVSMVILIATVLLVVPTMAKGADDRSFRFLVIVPAALACATVVWCIGGYELHQE